MLASSEPEKTPGKRVRTWISIGVPTSGGRGCVRPPARARGRCRPATVSSACGSTGSRTSRYSPTALGLPGRLTMRQRPRMPTTPRLSAASGVLRRVSSRRASARPGTGRSMARIVASGVTSRGPNPCAAGGDDEVDVGGPTAQPAGDEGRVVRHDLSMAHVEALLRQRALDGLPARVDAVAARGAVADRQDAVCECMRRLRWRSGHGAAIIPQRGRDRTM